VSLNQAETVEIRRGLRTTLNYIARSRRPEKKASILKLTKKVRNFASWRSAPESD
jgi:hypothetical protein